MMWKLWWSLLLVVVSHLHLVGKHADNLGHLSLVVAKLAAVAEHLLRSVHVEIEIHELLNRLLSQIV